MTEQHPVSGEQYERAVEAAVNECARLLNDDVDGNDAAKEAIDAYFASLREQGVRLVDLAEVTASLRAMAVSSPIPAIAAKLREAATAIERRFGGNERSE